MVNEFAEFVFEFQDGGFSIAMATRALWRGHA